ncbi:GPN-loop GTPase 1-like [Schistocerca gregaria]|uniref:GPN-loop GTPase 1-like n=1 Tax=Schistocerca gregaria TaxID=7010 RepID=UPI00211E3958|nr:GPN-loop GTPase 1-like [Schistocerca gregaria]
MGETILSSTSDPTWPHFGSENNKPLVCIIAGMAGTGKTTFMRAIYSYTSLHKIPSYMINLDPAVSKLPFSANIDIRDSVNYKEVMKKYQLGPNGGIMVSLNFFSTRFDQVMSFIEKRAPDLKYIFIDTPGQIEVFNWSASGTIIMETLASTFPTMFIYVADTPRCANPTTFMSNMLYACSILYKTRLPLLLTFNKLDVISHEFCLEWMQNSELFSEAISTQGTYMSNFTQSMSLTLQEFYRNLTTVGVSAVSGLGLDEFFQATKECAKQYESDYKPELLNRKAQILQQQEFLAKQVRSVKKKPSNANSQDAPTSHEDDNAEKENLTSESTDSLSELLEKQKI